MVYLKASDMSTHLSGLQVHVNANVKRSCTALGRLQILSRDAQPIHFVTRDKRHFVPDRNCRCTMSAL